MSYKESENGAALSINMLPPEILVHIFTTVCNVRTDTCPAEINSIGRSFLREPVTLSHVCSSWRQVAINSALLWSHIDLYPNQFQDPLLSTCLEAYVARSTKAILEVHVVVPYPDASSIQTASTILPFIKAIAPRIQSLVLKSRGGYYCAYEVQVWGSVLASCLVNCAPGILTKVSIDTQAYNQLKDNPVIHSEIQDGHLTPSAMESLWLPVKVLQLRDFHAEWTSKAYHGLVELRLAHASIRSPQLVSILNSSPHVRILELGTGVMLQDLEEPDEELAPVRLNNLELLVLNLESEDVARVLSLITPGSKPLSLSFDARYETQVRQTFSSNIRAEYESFVTRANIYRLNATEYTYLEITELLQMTPTARILAVTKLHWESTENDGGALYSRIPDFTLDSLYVLNSPPVPEFPWLETTIKEYSVRKLTLWRSSLPDDGAGERRVDRLSKICPIVNIVPDEEPNPIVEWC